MTLYIYRILHHGPYEVTPEEAMRRIDFKDDWITASYSLFREQYWSREETLSKLRGADNILIQNRKYYFVLQIVSGDDHITLGTCDDNVAMLMVEKQWMQIEWHTRRQESKTLVPEVKLL